MEENAVQIQWKKILCRFNGRKYCEDSLAEIAAEIECKKMM